MISMKKKFGKLRRTQRVLNKRLPLKRLSIPHDKNVYIYVLDLQNR
jgi:hypothetical protein